MVCWSRRLKDWVVTVGPDHSELKSTLSFAGVGDTEIGSSNLRNSSFLGYAVTRAIQLYLQCSCTVVVLSCVYVLIAFWPIASGTFNESRISV